MILQKLKDLLASVPAECVLDTEHLPDVEPALQHLLGISLCWAGSEGVYIPINHWEWKPSKELKLKIHDSMLPVIGSFLECRTFSGWNIEHDREWIDACFGIQSKWNIDGRILWYLVDTEQKERGYGLKSAQLSLLGWTETNNIELSAEVEAAGGKLSRGEHYLAGTDILAKYASLDAYSTYLCIEVCKRLGDEDPNLTSNHNRNRDYAKFLAETTKRGVMVDEVALVQAKNHYRADVDRAEENIRRVCSKEIEQLESAWYEQRIKGYKSDRGGEAFASNPRRHPRFNPRSSKHRTLLLHNKICLPIYEHTKTGKAKSDRTTISKYDHPAAKALVALSRAEKLQQFAKQYLDSTDNNGTIHFPHSTVATVSERLGGYAPYDLNMPFNSEPIMRAFGVRPGNIGIHMDLVSIEPCIIAAFSGDPTMVKIYRDGLGDIYLDLCQDLFPLNEVHLYDKEASEIIEMFHKEYNSMAPASSEQKDKFAKIRKVAKIIQLAVGYTGTKYTVAKNLNQFGFPISLPKAGQMVYRYWERFNKVRILAEKLKGIAEARGYINGLFNRRLYVPKKLTKDSLNRFSQHGAHGVLREIVMILYNEAVDGMYAILPDIHDSTSWEVPEEKLNEGVELFKTAIRRVNDSLCLPITIRGEIKTFHQFTGLKGKD